ncbi:unnamed protein product [Protopolystoma xenopodis]|uniref:Uncharacterized protein n=1 Tax=Protopolystoma xenopodis TaxID=117903 RepID=A0A448WXR0_9PLAT|nr:unnamed protein product [Protopolystoma xenopodis]
MPSAVPRLRPTRLDGMMDVLASSTGHRVEALLLCFVFSCLFGYSQASSWPGALNDRTQRNAFAELPSERRASQLQTAGAEWSLSTNPTEHGSKRKSQNRRDVMLADLERYDDDKPDVALINSLLSISQVITFSPLLFLTISSVKAAGTIKIGPVYVGRWNTLCPSNDGSGIEIWRPLRANKK